MKLQKQNYPPKRLAVIGVDPGAKGAFCLLIPETKQIMFKDTTLHARKLLHWVEAVAVEFNLTVVMIEEVGFIRGSAGKASINFGRSIERVNIIPEIALLTVDKVRPKAWQKFIGLVVPSTMSGPENAAKRKKYIKTEVSNIASRLYPKAELFGPKGGLLDGKADALMIAHYAAIRYKQ